MFLARGDEFQCVILFERSPSSINVSLVSIQTALFQMDMVFQNLLRSRQIVQDRARSHKGERKRQTPGLLATTAWSFIP